MVMKYLIGGSSVPRLESGKIESYCERIDTALAKGGKASIAQFETAAKIVNSVGPVTRDRRKGQKYTDELKEATATYVQGLKRHGKKR
jgi:hypothetical protein